MYCRETSDVSPARHPYRDRSTHGIVRQRSEGFQSIGLADGDGSGLTRGCWQSLQLDMGSSGLCLLLLLGVRLDSVNELLSALAVADVLDADIHSLLHVAVSNDL